MIDVLLVPSLFFFWLLSLFVRGVLICDGPQNSMVWVIVLDHRPAFGVSAASRHVGSPPPLLRDALDLEFRVNCTFFGFPSVHER